MSRRATSTIHSRFLAVLLALLPVVAPGIDGLPVDYTPIEDGHVDFAFCYEDGIWSIGLIHEEGGDPGNPAEGSPIDAVLAPMIAKDQPFSIGSRNTRATSAIWNFIGVAGGDPYWVFPQGAAAGIVYPGFSVCDIADATSYHEADPRVASTGKWTTVTLRQVDYIGKKTGGGKFSMWSEDSFGNPTVWMSTTDGISTSDKYFVQSDGHSHPNVAFSALGLYAVTFDLTFYEGPGKTNPNTSPMVTYYFAVGTYWEWLARHFDPTNWFLQSTMTGEQADPDKDGLPNLIEFACDLDPTTADHREFAAVPGKGTPSISLNGPGIQIQFPQRLASTNPQIITTVESSGSLGSASWAPSSGISAVAPLRTGWETVTHTISTAPSAQFLRLSVVLQSEVTY